MHATGAKRLLWAADFYILSSHSWRLKTAPNSGSPQFCSINLQEEGAHPPFGRCVATTLFNRKLKSSQGRGSGSDEEHNGASLPDL